MTLADTAMSRLITTDERFITYPGRHNNDLRFLSRIDHLDYLAFRAGGWGDRGGIVLATAHESVVLHEVLLDATVRRYAKTR